MRAPSPGLAPVTHLDETVLVAALIEGLGSTDPVKQKEAVGRYLHPDVKFSDHLCKSEGRWNVWKVLHAVTVMFEFQYELKHPPVIDKNGLRGVLFVEDVFWPNVPLNKYLFVPRRAPLVAYTEWARQPDGGLLITDLKFIHATTYLPSLFLGPVGTWLEANVVQPFGRFFLEGLTDLFTFLAATEIFVRKQLLSPSTSQSGPKLGKDLVG